jgi:hypothetical protein
MSKSSPGLLGKIKLIFKRIPALKFLSRPQPFNPNGLAIPEKNDRFSIQLLLKPRTIILV